MRMFQDNPKRRASRRRKARTAKQRAATRKLVAFNKARRRGKVAHRRRVSHLRRRHPQVSRRGAYMARKRQRRHAVRAAAPRRRYHRRRHAVARRRRTGRVTVTVRRNPGVVAMLTRGAVDAATAVVAKTGAKWIGTKLPSLAPGNTGQILNQVLVALGLGLIANRVPMLRGERARIVVQGALQAPIETALAPVLSSIGLSAYSAPTGMRAYVPRAIGPGGMAAYVQSPRTMAGDDFDFGMLTS